MTRTNNKARTRRAKKLAILFGGAATLAVAAPSLLQGVGDFLVAEDPLYAADAIITISGSGHERARTAAELLVRGYGRWLILSGTEGVGSGSALELARFARASGAPDQSLLLDDSATSTYENAVGSAQVMQRHGLRSAILVTSPYHMRRSVIEFRAVFHRQGLSVRAYPVSESFFDVQGWWRRARDRRLVIKEYGKLVAFLAGIR